MINSNDQFCVLCDETLAPYNYSYKSDYNYLTQYKEGLIQNKEVNYKCI